MLEIPDLFMIKVFRLSEVAGYLNDNNAFPEDSHVLGDPAYEIHQH